MAKHASTHKDLVVWHDATDLVVEIYQATAAFPVEERFGLTTQMRRAAVSVPANLAEGAARSGSAEFARYVSISRGSLSELETYLVVCRKLGYLTAPAALERRCDAIRAMLTNLHRTLRDRRG